MRQERSPEGPAIVLMSAVRQDSLNGSLTDVMSLF